MDSKKNLFSEFPSVSREEWEKVIEDDLRGSHYKTKLNWETGEGINALPFYRRDNLVELPAPVTQDQNDWEVRQPITEQSIEKANQVAKNALENGADALSFFIETRNADDAFSSDLHGTAIQNQKDFHGLLDGINLAETALHFNSVLASPILMAMLHNELDNQKIEPTALSGSILYDPYAFSITNGHFPNDEKLTIDQCKQAVQFCHSNLPNVKILGIDANTYHRAGGTIVQELGYALATGSEYLATLSESGLNTEPIARAIHFNFSIGSNYFLEIAKFRAVRKLWRTILDAYKVDDEQQAYVHASSSTWNKTLYDPYVNMLRTSTEGMSAAIAGCDALTLHPFDETFRQPNDFSRRIARNSQIIMKEEAYFNKVTDPGAGSYYIEKLTNKIAEAAWNCFREVEQQGGMLKSITDGYIQTALEESRNRRDQAIATRKHIFVGTNQYTHSEIGKTDEQETENPIVHLEQSTIPVNLDSHSIIQSLKKPLQQGVTLGDILPVLYTPIKLDITPIQTYRGAQRFESLRLATEEQSTTPRVLTLPLGNKKMRKARSAFTVNFFGCVGYDISDPIGFESTDKAILTIKKEKPDIVVLCSSDEEYKTLVPELCGKISDLDPQPITLLAGYPKAHVDKYLDDGIEGFIHSKCNVFKTLKGFQQKLGII